MRWTPTHEDVAPESVPERRDAVRREPQRPGTLVLLARAAAHDRISAALRDARARAGLSEPQAVDLMAARGVAISVAMLERWERTGGIRLEEAVDLAAVYHMSLDDLAHPRGAGRSRFAGPVEAIRLHAA
jgi:hypothetical protein